MQMKQQGPCVTHPQLCLWVGSACVESGLRPWVLSQHAPGGRAAHCEALGPRKDYVLRSWGKNQGRFAGSQSPASALAVALDLTYKMLMGCREERL